jgi:hypothetical protein
MIRSPPLLGPEFVICSAFVRVVPVWTFEKPRGFVLRVKNGAAVVFDTEGSKSANTVCGPFKMIVQLPVPEHAPDQPLKNDPLGATALSVTDVPSLRVAEHCAGQLIPTGLLVTVPVPVPVSVTTNGGTTKRAGLDGRPKDIVCAEAGAELDTRAATEISTAARLTRNLRIGFPA